MIRTLFYYDIIYNELLYNIIIIVTLNRVPYISHLGYYHPRKQIDRTVRVDIQYIGYVQYMGDFSGYSLIGVLT